MKIKFLFAAIFAACSMVLNAASISISNYDGVSTFSLVGDSNSTLLTSGVVVVGAYASEPASVAEVLNTFTAFGSIGFFGAGAPGFFTGGVSGPLVNADAFVGNNVYVVIGNGVDLNSSTEFAVWKAETNPAGNVFTADNPIGGPSEVVVLTGTGSLLVGSVVNFDVPNFGNQPGIGLAAIPEPSAILLGALGMVGLLRRRR